MVNNTDSTRRSPRFVVIGGGTGSYTVLNGLKNYVSDITAIVSMADSGGSTGILRDELGVLPPGDIRQCLVALSDSSDLLRDLFNYRFPEGKLAGHSVGNLFLSGVESMTGDFNEAVEIASKILDIKGQVLPMTLTNAQLKLDLPGKSVVGEHLILDTPIKREWQAKISLTPKCYINPKAEKAIMEADIIVIAPGNIYSSLAGALVVGGVKEALSKTKARCIFVNNLVNKPHQTANFAVHDCVDELERLIGQPVIDYVLYNVDRPSKELLDKYALDGELPVEVDEEALALRHYQAKSGNFLSHSSMTFDKNDNLMGKVKNGRSLIRHDSDAIARALMKVYFS